MDRGLDLQGISHLQGIKQAATATRSELRQPLCCLYHILTATRDKLLLPFIHTAAIRNQVEPVHTSKQAHAERRSFMYVHMYLEVYSLLFQFLWSML